MKQKYTRKVKNALPRRLRAEVLRDLEEIFASASEHGETEQQVIERLGCPCSFAKEAALQLGIDLEKRKKTRRIISLIISGTLAVILGALHSVISFKQRHDAAIGIIGGADGPTAIYVTGPAFTPDLLLLPAAVIAAVIALILLSKLLKKKK